MRKALLFPLLSCGAALTLALAACSGSQQPTDDASSAAPTAAVVTPASGSLAEALDDADGMQTMAEALKVTGIEGIFADRGSYTLLVPEDDAFDALGDKGKALTGSDDHAAMAALIKDHLMTGYMTPTDISAAIDASKDHALKVPTLGGTTLTFTKSGAKTDAGDEIVTVTSDDGSQATLDAGPVAAGASIAIPVTAVLRKF